MGTDAVDLGNLSGVSRQAASDRSDISRVRVVRPPANEGDSLTVALDGYSLAWPFDVPVGHWTPHGTALPQAGDVGLAIIDPVTGDAWLTGYVRAWTDPTIAPLTGAAWIAPTLINSWALAYGAGVADAGYLKDPFGFVRCRGRILGGASGSIAYQLPVRPGNTADTYPLIVFNLSTPIAGGASIDTSGNVRLYYAAGATDVGLSGITFLAEN